MYALYCCSGLMFDYRFYVFRVDRALIFLPFFQNLRATVLDIMVLF
jgi:hypothetical protein